MAGSGYSTLYGGQWLAHQQPDGPHNPEEIRTIFILGFPNDVKERELHNLLRWWPGYEASQLTFKGDQPMGFALFATHAMAAAALNAVQNLTFDPEGQSVLRAEMAKKNLYVKRGVAGVAAETAPFDQSKRIRTAGDYTSLGPYNSGAFALPSTWASQGYLPSFDHLNALNVPPIRPITTHIAPAGYAHVQNTKDNPPCNTLFVGNLGEHTSESELRGLFGSQPGFRQMKVLRQPTNTVCFIEFVDVKNAMAVHNNLQGAILSSSDRGSLRIQYSKNPFGKRKDASGHSSEDAAPGDSSANANGVAESH